MNLYNAPPQATSEMSRY